MEELLLNRVYVKAKMGTEKSATLAVAEAEAL